MDNTVVKVVRSDGVTDILTYPEFVGRLFKREGFNPLAHAVMGISGEAGELLDAVKRHVIYGKVLDRENVIEELGDLFFYMQALMIELDISEERVLNHNVQKLSKRYASGSYSDQAAIERADKREEEFNKQYPGDLPNE